MKHISKQELAARWQCHPTNIDYHVKMKRLRAKKVGNKMQYSMDDVFKFETERQKRIKIPVVSVTEVVHVSYWKKIVNHFKSCFR